MNDEERIAALDARLRRLIGGLDARPGFESRVATRVAARAVRADNREDLRAQYERRRELLRRRLKREAWTNGVTIAGVGFAAVTLVWRFAPEISRWAVGADATAGPGLLQVSGSLVASVLAVVLWPHLRKLPFLRDL